jgi:hypothetical protein
MFPVHTPLPQITTSKKDNVFLLGYNYAIMLRKHQSWNNSTYLRWIVLLGALVLISACSNEGDTTPTQGVYRPPTQAVTATPLPATTQEAEAERPTSEPTCTNALWFFQDLTIPDGTEVQPGERLDKRWLVQNAGTCNWDEGYEIRLEAGSNMGVPATQALFPARSGLQVTIRMNFIAPDEPDTYRSAWQAYDPDGVPFGDPFFIEVVVVDNTPPESDGGGD